MQTKPYNLQAPEAIAKEYGGNKQAIARAAQSGLVDPTAAVLAGMFIDRMRNAAAQEQAPQQTVAQQVLAPPQAPVGLGATPAAQQMPAPDQMGASPAMAGGGLTDLPVSESMFPDEYAGGGIVAFSPGGAVDPLFDLAGTYEAPQYDQFSEYQPRFPSIGEGNRRYKLKQLGYTNEQILRMPVAQQEFILQNIQTATSKPKEVAREERKAAPGPTPPVAAAPKEDMQVTAAAKPTLGATLQEIKALMPGGKPYEQLEKELLADKERRAAEKSEAGWLRLAEAGLGIAGGTSPYAMVNIGKGAAEALKGYAADLKDQKKLDREDRKILADIEKARRDEERGDVTAAVGSYEKALDRMSAEDRTRMTVSAYKQPAASIQEYNLWASQQPPGADKSLARFKREMGEAAAEAKDPMLSGLKDRLKGNTGGIKLSAEDAALLQRYLTR